MSDEDGNSGQDQPDEGERPERDRFGMLAERPWYRHPLVIITVAGAVLFLLNFYLSANRTAGVPLFG